MPNFRQSGADTAPYFTVFFASSRMLFYEDRNQERTFMEAKDRRQTIQELIKTNFEFKQLYKEHETLEDRLDQISKLKFVSEDDETKKKELQKKKLLGRDRMEEILRQYETQT
jgi:uncharacterized protein YdcH (DUF465 family)